MRDDSEGSPIGGCPRRLGDAKEPLVGGSFSRNFGVAAIERPPPHMREVGDDRAQDSDDRSHDIDESVAVGRREIGRPGE
jgi:hypothetical protein